MTTPNTTPPARKQATAKPKTRTSKNTSKKTSQPTEPEKTVHFYVLLDRSGSMESMKSDVIGGFNAFLAEQLATPGRARLTLVQFDSQDDQDVVLDAVRLAVVPPLTAATFSPRGGTPLLDATASIIERIHGRIAARAALGKTAEEIVVITITDGEENSSAFANLEQVCTLVGAGKEAGWSFVFLGAGMDAYAEAQQLGYDDGSIQAFAAHGLGAKTMWLSVSRASSQLRADIASHMAVDKAAYFRGLKEAEAQRQSGEQQ